MINAMSIRTRLAVLAAVAVTLAVAGACGVAYLVVDRSMHRELDRGLARHAAQLTREMRNQGWAATGQCTWPTAPCAQMVAADGGVDPLDVGLPVTSEVREVARGSRARLYQDGQVDGMPVRMLAVELDDGMALQVGASTDAIERGLGQVRAALLLTVLAGAVVAAVVASLVSRTALRPLRRLTEAAERVASSRDAGQRMAVSGPDELSRLAAGVNVMLEALDGSMAAQRMLVADASHELRTPLTSLGADLDVLDRVPPERRAELMARLRGQLDGMTGLVGDLIELARGDKPADPIEDVRLDRLVRHCLAATSARWPAVEFAADLDASMVAAMPRRLSRAVANLLDNAAKFAGSAGPVLVRVRGSELSVHDCGPGIAAVDAPHVFDRFYRSDAVRGLPGSGLGLAIVAQVARELDAELAVEAAACGGTVIRLRLPARTLTNF